MIFGGFLNQRGNGHGVHYDGTAVPGLSVLQNSPTSSLSRFRVTVALAGIPSTNTTARFPVRTINPHDAHSLIQGNASGEADMPRISPGHLLASALEIDSGSAHREGQPQGEGGMGGVGVVSMGTSVSWVPESWSSGKRRSGSKNCIGSISATCIRYMCHRPKASERTHWDLSWIPYDSAFSVRVRYRGES